MDNKHILKTLDRSLHVLTMFDAQHPEWGVTELARHLALPKSVVQKTLATFVKRGFLYQDQLSRRYRLGPRILSLARVAEPEVARLAKPHLARLAEAAGETAKLTVVDGGETVIVAAVESRHSLHMDGRVGRRNPLYGGASNKLLAAYMPWTDVEPIVRLQLTRDIPFSKPIDEQLDELRRELRKIRRVGYATSVGEREPGVKAVTVPLWGHDGKIAASLSVVGPANRMDDTGEAELLTLLHKASRDISEAIGYTVTGFEGGDASSHDDV